MVPGMAAFAFENLAPGRDVRQVRREIGALANNVNPDHRRPSPRWIGLAECLGYDLVDLWHYGEPIRDRSRPSRANLALYVRGGREREHRWVDLDERWPRTQHPGMHEPRSILIATDDESRVVVGHAPPDVPGASEARREWLFAMADLLARERPTIALTDPNGLGPVLVRAATARARRRGLDHVIVSGGNSVEAVHARGFVIDAAITPGKVNGVPMLTDHRRCLLGRARLRGES